MTRPLTAEQAETLQAIGTHTARRLSMPSPGVPVVWETGTPIVGGRRGQLRAADCERLAKLGLISPLRPSETAGGYVEQMFVTTVAGWQLLARLEAANPR